MSGISTVVATPGRGPEAVIERDADVHRTINGHLNQDLPRGTKWVQPPILTAPRSSHATTRPGSASACGADRDDARDRRWGVLLFVDIPQGGLGTPQKLGRADTQQLLSPHITP